MAKKISQREARRLRKQVAELCTKIVTIQSTWRREYPNGSHVGSHTFVPNTPVVEAIRTCHKLGFAVVVTMHNSNELAFYGVSTK